jgi:hypothetical protein
MQITGHHTCKKTGNPAEIKKPFFASHGSEESDKKFLGSGYYFWDNNIGVAHWWGQKNYQKKYYIFEGNINATKGIFLDLVGNRDHILLLQEMMQLLMPYNTAPDKKWKLGNFIELCKSLEQKQEYKGIFPFQLIRAVDSTFEPKEKIEFIEGNKHFLNLNPVFIVCLLDLSPQILSSFKHIRTGSKATI